MLLLMQSQIIKILHFNDVYNIEERVNKAHGDLPDLCPGAARFVTAIESRGSEQKLVLFSGDLFAPSNLGAHFKGEQMLEIFKRLNVAVSCLGNHDTDYGLAKMSELIEKTKGVWLMANLYLDGKIIGNLPRSHTILHNGHKLGFFGLCEPDWI